MNTTQFLEALEDSLIERKENKLRVYSHVHRMGRQVNPIRLSLTRTGPRTCPITYLANRRLQETYIARDFQTAARRLNIDRRTLIHIVMASDLSNRVGHTKLRTKLMNLLVKYTTRVR
jgi:hypothetical protein